jgi:hypothetical protein
LGKEKGQWVLAGQQTKVRSSCAHKEKSGREDQSLPLVIWAWIIDDFSILLIFQKTISISMYNLRKKL